MFLTPALEAHAKMHPPRSRPHSSAGLGRGSIRHLTHVSGLIFTRAHDRSRLALRTSWTLGAALGRSPDRSSCHVHHKPYHLGCGQLHVSTDSWPHIFSKRRCTELCLNHELLKQSGRSWDRLVPLGQRLALPDMFRSASQFLFLALKLPPWPGSCRPRSA